MFCSNCGSQTLDEVSFCEKCGTALVAKPDGRMRGAPPARGAKVYAVDKSAGVALLLSLLIPGVGQFYNGDTKRGLLIFGIWFVSWFLLGAGIGFVGLAGAWIWGMINAYQVASGKMPMM
jgi:TM2 domain-containing membrane protein YozV